MSGVRLDVDLAAAVTYRLYGAGALGPVNPAPGATLAARLTAGMTPMPPLAIRSVLLVGPLPALRSFARRVACPAAPGGVITDVDVDAAAPAGIAPPYIALTSRNQLFAVGLMESYIAGLTFYTAGTVGAAGAALAPGAVDLTLTRTVYVHAAMSTASAELSLVSKHHRDIIMDAPRIAGTLGDHVPTLPAALHAVAADTCFSDATVRTVYATLWPTIPGAPVPSVLPVGSVATSVGGLAIAGHPVATAVMDTIAHVIRSALGPWAAAGGADALVLDGEWVDDPAGSAALVAALLAAIPAPPALPIPFTVAPVPPGHTVATIEDMGAVAVIEAPM